MGPEAGLEGDARRWRASADEIRRAILDEAWVDELGAISEQLGGGGLDASVLALPLRRVLDASHPKMISTTGEGQNGPYPPISAPRRACRRCPTSRR